MGNNHTKTQDTLNRELCEACFEGNTKLVKKLIYQGADVNCYNESGYTPLFLSLSSGYPHIGDTKLIEILLENGANVYNEDTHFSVFIYMCNSYRTYSSLIPIVMKYNPTIRCLQDGLLCSFNDGHYDLAKQILKHEESYKIILPKTMNWGWDNLGMYFDSQKLIVKLILDYGKDITEWSMKYDSRRNEILQNIFREYLPVNPRKRWMLHSIKNLS
jgi:hypothetical protein